MSNQYFSSIFSHASINRRAFMHTGSALALFKALPRPRSSRHGPRFVSPREATAFGPPDTDLMRSVALRAVDAARSAGATYADARLVRIINQATVSRTNRVIVGIGGDWSTTVFNDRPDVPQSAEIETHGIAVRALVDGAWGLTASPWWTMDEATALARDAVAQARDNAQWSTSRIELAPAPVTVGTWTTPFRIDPFSVPIEEKMAFVENALDAYRAPYRVLDRELDASAIGVACGHTTRLVATSEGACFTQHFYDTRIMRRQGHAYRRDGLEEKDQRGWKPHSGESYVDDGAVPYGTGWEAVIDVDLWSWGKQAAEDAYARFFRRPAKAVEIGQYTVVLDAEIMAKVLDLSIARATDIDRIVGNEVNSESGGGSYLGTDPLQLLGNYSFGTPALNVTTTRAGSVGAVGGLPAAKWDDEGVPTAPFTLIKDGILQDLATTRESAARLAPYYRKTGRPVASNGCATSETALDLTAAGPPTLVLSPNVQDVTLDTMISNVAKGLVFRGGGVTADFQFRRLTIAESDTQEIINGRLGSSIARAVVVIDTTQLWKNLLALGGKETSRGFERIGAWEKGQPSRSLTTSVVAVPATFAEMSVIDVARRR